MADEDVYELHVCEAGRWSCAERFRSHEREEAIAEAGRQFSSPAIEAVRVIRETYDQNEQVFKQRTVFRNAKPKTDIPSFNASKVPPPRKQATPPPRATPRAETAKPTVKPSPSPPVRLGAIKHPACRTRERLQSTAF